MFLRSVTWVSSSRYWQIFSFRSGKSSFWWRLRTSWCHHSSRGVVWNHSWSCSSGYRCFSFSSKAGRSAKRNDPRISTLFGFGCCETDSILWWTSPSEQLGLLNFGATCTQKRISLDNMLESPRCKLRVQSASYKRLSCWSHTQHRKCLYLWRELLGPHLAHWLSPHCPWMSSAQVHSWAGSWKSCEF